MRHYGFAVVASVAAARGAIAPIWFDLHPVFVQDPNHDHAHLREGKRISNHVTVRLLRRDNVHVDYLLHRILVSLAVSAEFAS
jgi:hypothetical protein